MRTIGEALGFVVGKLSDQDHAQSLVFYRFWFETGGSYLEIPSHHIFDAIWNHREAVSSINPGYGRIFHASAHLILRFASDAESDRILAPYSSGLQSRLCAKSLREFSSSDLMLAPHDGNAEASFSIQTSNSSRTGPISDTWKKLRFATTSCGRLSSHPKPCTHQIHVLIILFKVAGATFEAYVDPSVVDRCFELLKTHTGSYPPDYSGYDRAEFELKTTILVGVPCVSKGSHRTKANLREPSNRQLRYGVWLGGTPSPTCVHDKEAQTS